MGWGPNIPINVPRLLLPRLLILCLLLSLQLDNEETARILGVVPLLSSRAEVKEDPSRAAEYTQHRSCHHTFTLDTNTSLSKIVSN